MASYNTTVFQCENEEVLNAFKSACERDGKGHEIFMRGNQVHLSTAWRTGHENAVAISKKFPEEVITCSYSFEHNWYSEIYKHEYRAGESKLVELSPNYMTQIISRVDEADSDAITEKALEFCRRLDVVGKDEKGEPKINWHVDEVVFTFEHEGRDGKRYKIQAEKNHFEVSFKIFEAVQEWRLIEDPEDNNFSVTRTPQAETCEEITF